MLFKCIKWLNYLLFKKARIEIERGTDLQIKYTSITKEPEVITESYVIYKEKNIITGKVRYVKDIF
jgi:hypothetical protein